MLNSRVSTSPYWMVLYRYKEMGELYSYKTQFFSTEEKARKFAGDLKEITEIVEAEKFTEIVIMEGKILDYFGILKKDSVFKKKEE